MHSGEKHALAAGFFVMLSLAAAFGIGWWATLPPASGVANSERTTPVKAWALAEEELPRPDSSGSSETAAPAGKQALAEEKISITVPEVNEIRLSEPRAEGTGAEIASEPPAASGRSSGPAAPGTRAEEVDRLKAQAYSETRQDRLGRPAPAKPASKGKDVKPRPVSSQDSLSSAQKPDLRRALAKCQDEEGLFFQERCKWRLCNGQWGKYGCPSYGRDKRDDYSVS